MSQKTVIINGVAYDKHTGLPLRGVDSTDARNKSHAHSLHQRTQKSSTLHRGYVKSRDKQPAKKAVNIEVKSTPTAKRSPMIQKYAKHPKTSTPHQLHPAMSDTGPIVHPMVQRVHAAKTAQRPAKQTHKPSEIIKKEAVEAALTKAPTHHRQSHRDKTAHRTKKQRFNQALSFASTGIALLMIAGYFTYMNMPNLSVRVAAVQAGVDASYPGYRPSGYSLAGRIAYNEGEVSMRFAANGTPQSFTLKQSKSGWDSSAVLDNYVAPLAGDEYVTTTEGGLTIYSFNGDAAWVNNGVLYTIDGDAILTSEQIRNIAISL